MIYLHSTIFPCNQNRREKTLELTELESSKRVEAIKFSDGWGIFDGNKRYWVNQEEKEKISRIANDFYEFNNETIEGKSWHSSAPIDLEVELLRQCNEECIHCWNKSDPYRDILEFDCLYKLIEDFRKGGGQRILFTGGEPLMYPRLEEVLETSKSLGVRKINLITNGSLINRNSATMLSKYFDTINVSIHGDCADVHDAISRRKGSFERTKRGIQYLRENDIRVLVYFTLMEQNFESLPNMFDLVKKWDCSGIRFKPINVCGRGSDLLPISEEGKKILRENIEKVAKQTGVKVLTSELFKEEYSQDCSLFRFYGCDAFRTQAYIQSNGDILPCSILFQRPFGNIYQNTLLNVWHSKEVIQFRDNLSCSFIEEKCNNCGGLCKNNEKWK